MANMESGILGHQSGENTSWRKDLICQLRDRNRTQTQCFYDLISLRKISTQLILYAWVEKVSRARGWSDKKNFYLLFMIWKHHGEQLSIFVLFTDNRLFDNSNTLRGENLQLSISNEKLRCELSSCTPGSAANAALEAKLLAQADELTILHRRRGEHTQQIVDLNHRLQEITKELQAKEAR